LAINKQLNATTAILIFFSVFIVFGFSD